MNKSMKKFVFIALLTLTVFCSQSTWAILTSSYYDGWMPYDTDDGLATGWINFAVYDTEHLEYGSEHEENGIVKHDGWDQYIYAYQIIHDNASGIDVTGFSVLDIDGGLLADSLVNNTSSQDDENGGIAPLTSDTEGVWTWDLVGGNGYISAGEHSSLLVYTSDQSLTKGTFEIETSGMPVPIQTHAPEPTTIALLGLGSLMLTVRQRKRSRL